MENSNKLYLYHFCKTSQKRRLQSVLTKKHVFHEFPSALLFWEPFFSFLLVSLARDHHNGCVCVGIFCVCVSLCIIRWKFCPWLLEFLLKQLGTVKCAGSSLDQLHTFLLDYLSSMCVMSAFVYDLNWMHTSSQVEHCGINEERSNEFLAEWKNFVYDKLS